MRKYLIKDTWKRQTETLEHRTYFINNRNFQKLSEFKTNVCKYSRQNVYEYFLSEFAYIDLSECFALFFFRITFLGKKYLAQFKAAADYRCSVE